MKSIDSIIEEFDLTKPAVRSVDKRSITLWLPVEYKEKFDLLQGRSNRLFGKKLQEVLMQAIDRVPLEEERSA